MSGCFAEKTDKVSDSLRLEEYQVIDMDVIERQIIKPDLEDDRIVILPQLRPSPDDILTKKIDLNNDGKMDVIGTIFHYRYMENKKYPLYIFIANEYDYDLLDTLFISTFNFDINDSENWKELIFGEDVFKYDGKNYKKVR
jgi:hypothetical protein